MIPYKYILRVCEGNKRLARSTQAYLEGQWKFSESEYKERIRPLMIAAEADILKTLNDQTTTTWQASNLKNILADIEETVSTLDANFKLEMPGAYQSASVFGDTFVGKNLSAIGVTGITLDPGLSRELVEILTPFGNVFVSNFTGDMAKILRAEISTGLVSNKTVSEVAQGIREKFLSSDMSYARAERIATTEMMRAMSMTQNSRAKEIAAQNNTVRKAWISSHKPEARVDHLAVEAQTLNNPIPVDQDFNVAGEKAQFPRDPRLSAKQTVHCGCTQVMVTVEMEQADFDLKDAFSKQLEDGKERIKNAEA